MIVRQGRPFRWQLMLLCTGLLVPTVIFVGVLLWRLAGSERSRAEEEALGISHALAVTLDREILGVLTTLQALATSPSLQSGDLASFYEQISSMRQLQGIHISLRDTDAHTLLTTRATLGTVVEVPPQLALADRQVLQSDRSLVTDMFLSAIVATPVFQIIAAPVRVGGEPKYLLAASLDPDYLADAFKRENLPKGWIGTLVDHNWLFVVRTEGQDTFSGKLVGADFRANAIGQSGFYYGRNVTGMQSLVGFNKSLLTGWTAAVNVPTSTVDAPLRQSIMLLVGLGVCLAAAASVFAIWVAHRINGALLQLRVAAEAIGQGRPVGEVTTTLAEVNEVGAALHAASKQLKSRAEERDTSEATLRDSEAHLAGVFAQTGAGFAEALLNGRYISANDHYCKLVDRSLAELLCMRLQDIPHPDDYEVNRGFMQRTLDTGEAVTAEKRFVRGDGQIIWVANTISLIRTAKAEPTLLSVAIDISEQKRVERDLEAAKEAAEQANVAKSTFMANMSHELRTPLSAIIGYTEMLREEVQDGAEPADFVTDLGKVESNARHLLGLINDVLDLSKIESGKMEVFAEAFDTPAMVRDVAATVESLVRKKGNALSLDVEPGLGSMRSDVTKVRQILLNLLSNAAKFTENGTVTLSAARDLQDPENVILFRVRDEGIGMTEEQQAKLFQRFIQADASTTRKFGGTGLGLSIVKAFATMLGGSITVQSTPGVGSTFSVRLRNVYAEVAPGVLDQAHSQEAGGKAEAGVAPEEVILVIDDDPAQQELMARFLVREGFIARAAHDGATGLAMAKSLRPKVILLDVTMPGMDGWSVLRTLKADPELADTPVVMVTFISDSGLANTLGAADYVTKPVRWERFRQVMDRFRDHDGDVLVVDDDHDSRARLRAALERDDWSVAEAVNGKDALDQVARSLPRAVLLDLEMPVMDGFAFLHAFREVPGCRDIPVIVVTARDLTRQDRQELLEAARVLSKTETSLLGLSGEVKAVLGRARESRVE